MNAQEIETRVLGLNLQELSQAEIDWLHELKSQAMRKVAQEYLLKERGY